MFGDRGYDDAKLNAILWDDHRIKLVIDIMNMWKDEEETHLLCDHENVVHNYKGNVYCYCPMTEKQREMVNGGFEKDRDKLKKYVRLNNTGSPVKVH